MQIQLDSGFWQDPRVTRLSMVTRYVYLYLMTGPQTDVCGLFAFSPALAAERMGMAYGMVQQSLRELAQERIVDLDLDAGAIWLRVSFLTPSRGRLHEKHRKNQAEHLPSRRLARDFLALGKAPS